MTTDKGRTTVILNIKTYIPRANGQLQYNSLYQKLNADPITKHSDFVNRGTENLRKQELLSNFIASKLTVDEVRTPQFHILPQS